MGYATDMFAKRLKELREAAGLTQEQLAKELKVSRGAISYYEKGDRTPDIEFLDSVAEYFMIPLDFAMGYTGNIKEEHKNMYDFYGLTDEACTELDHHPEIGHLISVILGHEKFFALKKLYKGMIENYKDFNHLQHEYISFLITDILDTIIQDSIRILLGMQYTPEEIEALKSRVESINAKADEVLAISKAEEEVRKKKYEEEDRKLAELDAKENATRYSAIDKVYEKFKDVVDSAEFRRKN